MRLTLLFAFVTVAAGCSAPMETTGAGRSPAEFAVLKARRAAERAATDPALEPYLADALRDLDRAEAALAAGDLDEAEHRAYVAEKGVQIAALQREIDDAEREVMGGPRADGPSVLLTDAFETGQTDLRPALRPALAEVAEFLRDHPDRVVLVEGFTDSSGDADRNLDLSIRRAEAVRARILETGVAPERVLAVGYGEDYPLESNDSAAGRSLNRRIEITVGRRIADLPVR